MRKSTSKEALTLIRSHVNDALIDFCADLHYEDGNPPKSYHERCKEYYEDAIERHDWLRKRGELHTYQELVMYSIETGSGGFECYRDPVVARLKEWLDETDDEVESMLKKHDPFKTYGLLVSREIVRGATSPTKAMLKKD
jgi:hypothetical protein